MCESYSTKHKLIQKNLKSYLPKDSINSLATTISFPPTSKQSPIPQPSPSSTVLFDIPCPTTTSIPPGLSFTSQLPFHVKSPENFQHVYSPIQKHMPKRFTTSTLGTFFTIANKSLNPLTLDPSVTIGTIHFTHNDTPLRRPHRQNLDTHDSTSWRKGMFRLSCDEFIFHDSSSKRNGKAKRVIIPNAPPIVPNSNETPSLQNDTISLSNLDTDSLSHTLDHTPLPLPCTSVPSNTPKHIRFTHDRLLKNIGFLSNPKLHKSIPMAAQPTISIQDFDRNPTLNPGEIASLRAADRNKSPSPLPERAGDLFHCDIGFGPTSAIGRASYCLTLVDAKSRHTFIYPLKNLTTDLVSQFQQFLTDVAMKLEQISIKNLSVARSRNIY